jgi:hypothetical protein
MEERKCKLSRKKNLENVGLKINHHIFWIQLSYILLGPTLTMSLEVIISKGGTTYQKDKNAFVIRT